MEPLFHLTYTWELPCSRLVQWREHDKDSVGSILSPKFYLDPNDESNVNNRTHLNVESLPFDVTQLQFRLLFSRTIDPSNTLGFCVCQYPPNVRSFMARYELTDSITSTTQSGVGTLMVSFTHAWYDTVELSREEVDTFLEANPDSSFIFVACIKVFSVSLCHMIHPISQPISDRYEWHVPTKLVRQWLRHKSISAKASFSSDPFIVSGGIFCLKFYPNTHRDERELEYSVCVELLKFPPTVCGLIVRSYGLCRGTTHSAGVAVRLTREYDYYGFFGVRDQLLAHLDEIEAQYASVDLAKPADESKEEDGGSDAQETPLAEVESKEPELRLELATQPRVVSSRSVLDERFQDVPCVTFEVELCLKAYQLDKDGPFVDVYSHEDHSDTEMDALDDFDKMTNERLLAQNRRLEKQVEELHQIVQEHKQEHRLTVESWGKNEFVAWFEATFPVESGNEWEQYMHEFVENGIDDLDVLGSNSQHIRQQLQYLITEVGFSPYDANIFQIKLSQLNSPKVQFIRWLSRDVGLPQYVSNFVSASYDDMAFMHPAVINDDVLRDRLRIPILGHRLRILNKVLEIQHARVDEIRDDEQKYNVLSAVDVPAQVVATVDVVGIAPAADFQVLDEPRPDAPPEGGDNKLLVNRNGLVAESVEEGN